MNNREIEERMDDIRKIIKHDAMFYHLKNRYIAGAGYTMASNILVGLMNFVFNTYAATTLGPSGYGDLAALFSWASLLTVPLGIANLVIVGRIGSHGKKGAQFASSLEPWAVRLVKRNWFIPAFLIACIPFIPYLTNLSYASGYVLIPLVILTCVTMLYDSIMQGMKLFAWFSIISVFVVAIKLSGALLSVFFPSSLIFILVAISLSYVIRALVSRKIIFRKLHPYSNRVRPLEKTVTDILKNRQVVLTAVSFGMLVLVQHLPVVYIKYTLSPEDAGIFGAWMVMSNIALFVLGPLLSIGYIFFSSKKDPAFHTTAMNMSLFAVLIVGSGYVLSYVMFGNILVHILFGSAFAGVNAYILEAALYGTGTIAVILFTNYYLAAGSRVVSIAAGFVILYGLALFLSADSLKDVIRISLFSIYMVLVIYATAYAGIARRVLQFWYAHSRT